MVYLTQSFPHGKPGHLKIGYTKSPQALVKRLQALQTGQAAPLKLLGVADVGSEWERWLHELLAQYRATGEWFAPHDDVRDAFYGVAMLGRVMQGRMTPPVTKDAQLRLVAA